MRCFFNFFFSTPAIWKTEGNLTLTATCCVFFVLFSFWFLFFFFLLLFLVYSFLPLTLTLPFWNIKELPAWLVISKSFLKLTFPYPWDALAGPQQNCTSSLPVSIHLGSLLFPPGAEWHEGWLYILGKYYKGSCSF